MPQVIRTLFEKEFSKKFNIPHAIAVNSGTSALIATLWHLLKTDSKNEVITTPFTHISTINAIMIAGGKPIYVDILEENYLINHELIEEKITENTVAILPVHLFGKVCNMEYINKLAKKHQLYVVEDAAQVFGVKHNNKFAGTIGDFGCFSFYKTKNFSTFEGGMITINKQNDNVEKIIRSITSQGEEVKGYSNRIGFNFRMPEPCALIGYEQIKLKDPEDYVKIMPDIGPHKGYYYCPAYRQYGLESKEEFPITEKIVRKVIKNA